MTAPQLPVLLLGGEVPDDPGQALDGWRKALKLPNIKGIVAGRSLLYPADGDASAVSAASLAAASQAPQLTADRESLPGSLS
jgi:hypothetical protein